MTVNAVMSKHWRVRQRAIAEVRAAGALLAAECVPCPVGEPVDLIVAHFFKEPRPDTAAIAPTVKALVDGFTDAGVWPDDNPDHVRDELYLVPEHDKADPRIRIGLRRSAA